MDQHLIPITQKNVQPRGFLVDVDKTLTTLDLKITDYTLEILNQLFTKGEKIGLSTGRSYAALQHYVLPHFPENSLHVVSGGAQVITSTGKVIWSQELPAELVKTMTTKISELGGQFCFGQGELFYASPDFYQRLVNHPWNIPLGELNQLSAWHTPLLTVTNLNEPIREFLITIPGLNLKEMIGYSGSPYFDITVEGVNKLKAAEIWAEHQGLHIDQIIAVGDSANDLEVIGGAGFGVAMGNATDDVKAIADRVIGHTNEDGLAHFLAEYL